VARFAFSQLAALSGALVAAACSSTPVNGGASAAGGSGGTAGSSGAGNAGSSGTSACPGPGYHVDESPILIDGVGAQIVDSAQAPLAGVPVQVCGLDVCFNGISAANGSAEVDPAMNLARPAYKYGDGLDYARLAVLLPASPPKQSLGNLQAMALPSYASGTPFPASGSFSAGPVTLTLAPGTDTEHDLLTYSADQLVLRVVEIPLAVSTQAVPASFGFARAYALAPLGTTFCPAAALSLPNTEGWAPGTAAEIFIQGLEVDEAFAQYATWTQVADATVSSDGASIDSQSGGIPILSAIGVRKK
jgi:hypothetical protein